MKLQITIQPKAQRAKSKTSETGADFHTAKVKVFAAEVKELPRERGGASDRRQKTYNYHTDKGGESEVKNLERERERGAEPVTGDRLCEDLQ